MGGTNDASVHSGSWNSTDTSTLFGALNVLFTRLQQTFAGKPILVCTMIQSRDSYSSNVADPLNVLLNEKTDSDTLSLQLRAEAIKAKAHQYGIPCLDLFNESGISGVDSDHVYYRSNDTLHPSSAGQKRMASLIQNKLESLFIE
jgi:lysophospholipase L1-like esterase